MLPRISPRDVQEPVPCETVLIRYGNRKREGDTSSDRCVVFDASGRDAIGVPYRTVHIRHATQKTVGYII